jgi:hypothetical protein
MQCAGKNIPLEKIQQKVDSVNSKSGRRGFKMNETKLTFAFLEILNYD